MSDLLDDDPAQAAPPRSLILTMYGLYAPEVGGGIGVRPLIPLFAKLAADAEASRSPSHRPRLPEILVSERRGARAGYAPCRYAGSVLETGDRRIFERHTAPDD